MSPPSEFPVYKPSVWYFRDDLNRSPDRAFAINVALTIADEVDQLRTWMIGQGAFPPLDFRAAVGILRMFLAKSTSHGQAIMIGLYLCHELEQLKAHARACGMIPPKWNVSPSEAADKNWESA